MSHDPIAFLDAIPVEILEEILCRLSVQCLLRLKCLSRSWHALITSHTFVNLYRSLSPEPKINLRLFLWGYRLFRVEFDSLHNDSDFDLAVVHNHPLNNPNYILQLWGSCNGLICMSNSLGTVFLWNPLTKQSRELPRVPNLSNLVQEIHYGITFTCGDYKVGRVVELRNLNGEFLDYEIMVYSLSSNSWHKSKKFPHPPNLYSARLRNTTVGGALHWISRLENLIVAFHLGTETYRVIPQPEFQRFHFQAYLHTLGECLSVTCHYDSMTAEIWLLKNYGKENEYWLRLLTLVVPEIPNFVYHLVPVAYSNCGKKVMLEMNYEKLIWYNLEQNSVEDILQVEDINNPHAMEDEGQQGLQEEDLHVMEDQEQQGLQEEELHVIEEEQQQELHDDEDVFAVIPYFETIASLDALAAAANDRNPEEDEKNGQSISELMKNMNLDAHEQEPMK